MSVISYLVSLVQGSGDLSRKLDRVLANQEKIMATGQELKDKIAEIQSKLGEVAVAQEQQGSALTNVAGDLQRLKEQIGSGEPGIPAEEAAEVGALLDSVIATVTQAAESATEGAAALQALADLTPEP